MKKIVLSFVFLFFLVFNSFSITFDILGTFNYKNALISGNTYLNNENTPVNYNAAADSVGVNFGLDLFFNKYVGVYTRMGLYGVTGLNRTVGPYENKINGVTDYGASLDIGGAFALPLGDYFSFNAAPSFTLNVINSSSYKYGYYDIISTVDSFLNIGFTADIYFKFRYKHFMAAIGCAGSALPFGFVTSSDTRYDYHSAIDNIFMWSVRPYIGAGVSF